MDPRTRTREDFFSKCIVPQTIMPQSVLCGAYKCSRRHPFQMLVGALSPVHRVSINRTAIHRWTPHVSILRVTLVVHCTIGVFGVDALGLAEALIKGDSWGTPIAPFGCKRIFLWQPPFCKVFYFCWPGAHNLVDILEQVPWSNKYRFFQSICQCLTF